MEGDSRVCFEVDEPGEVYAIAVERMTGKETPLPAVSQQWPARDNTKSPDAVAPPRT